jgi:hypothetical protein
MLSMLSLVLFIQKTSFYIVEFPSILVGLLLPDSSTYWYWYSLCMDINYNSIYIITICNNRLFKWSLKQSKRLKANLKRKKANPNAWKLSIHLSFHYGNKNVKDNNHHQQSI